MALGSKKFAMVLVYTCIVHLGAKETMNQLEVAFQVSNYYILATKATVAGRDHYYLVCVFSSTSGTHIGGEASSRLRPIAGEEELRKEVKDSVIRSPRELRLDTDSRS